MIKGIFLFFIIQNFAFAQLINSVEVNQKLNVMNEADAKKELLHFAVLKSIEKFAPEMGYKVEEFNSGLKVKFNGFFEGYKQRKLTEKFGTQAKENLSEVEKKAFSDSLDKERDALFIQYAQFQNVLRSHSFSTIAQNPKDPNQWNAKINVDLDKAKLEKTLRRVISNEKKAFSKIYLISEVDPIQFTWGDLKLDGPEPFLKPLNDTWIKWLNENLPNSVEEVVSCDNSCLGFYSYWMEHKKESLVIPEAFHGALFLKINLYVKRLSYLENGKEMKFEWEGRTLIQDIGTKRILGSYTIPLESRSFRAMEQKVLNSSIASSLYRSPLPGFLDLNKKLEEKIGFSHSTKVVVKGHRNLGDVMALSELLKTRGSSLGLEVFIDSFSKDEANLVCYFQGEEKKFTDLLSSIKELKSNHRYTLVNEFTGVHHVIKLVN